MTAKEQLNSADVHVLTKELNKELNSARIEKIYQVSKRILKIRTHIPNKGSRDLIIAPNFVCITHYTYEAPELPSSFAMQLRKHLNGAFIRKISQHNFDRILEFEIESKDVQFLLIAELFSSGNVLLCDNNRKIMGLLEWQEWKDRKLGVGQRYEYPPEKENPMLLDYARFKKTLESDKKIVALLAGDIGLGRSYAEELCLLSGFDKETKSSNLKENETEILFSHFKKLMTGIKDERADPTIVLDENNNPVDVIPFDLGIYRNLKKKRFDSFNDAVDEYSSNSEFVKLSEDAEKNFRIKLEKLQKIEEQQRETIRQFEENAEEFRRIGDLIYQNLSGIEEITRLIRKERESGKRWENIKKDFLGSGISGIRIEDIREDEGLVILDAL